MNKQSRRLSAEIQSPVNYIKEMVLEIMTKSRATMNGDNSVNNKYVADKVRAQYSDKEYKELVNALL
jgi:hypothetical protein